MKSKFLLLLAFCITVLSALAQTREQALDLVTPTGTLKGTLLLPAGSKKVPVVLLHAGSGPTDRNGNNPVMPNNSLKMVAEALQSQGIASLRFDKRGIAESKEAGLSEAELRFDRYIEDATAWLELLKKDKRFSSVVMLGHSEGALIGMVAAYRAKAHGFISLAGAGQSADKVIKAQLAGQPQPVKDVAFPVLDQLVKGQTVAEVDPMLAAIFRPSVQPYLISWFKYDPQEEIKKLTVPVLIIQGEQDLQVSVQDARQLVAAAPNSKLLLLPTMNHVLKETTADRAANIATYSNPTLPLAPTLAAELVTFIKDIK